MKGTTSVNAVVTIALDVLQNCAEGNFTLSLSSLVSSINA